MEKRIKKDARKDVDGPQDAYRSRRVVGSHVEGPAVFYFANNRRALCFRHCQADSNARTKVIMKRYLFKCIGAWCHPRRSLLNLSLYIYKPLPILIPYSFIPLPHLRSHSFPFLAIVFSKQCGCLHLHSIQYFPSLRVRVYSHSV